MSDSTTRQRPALLAVAATFGVNAGVTGALLPRFPEIADTLGAGEAAFGLALLAGGTGGLLGSLVMPRVVAAVGGLRPAIAWSVPVMVAAGVTAAAAPTLVAFAVALAVLGLADGVLDPSMNELAVAAQRDRGRSVMGRMHATWSATMTASVAVGTVAAGLGVPVALHLLAVGSLLLVVQAVAQRHLPAGPAMAGPTGPAQARPRGRHLGAAGVGVVVLGVAAAWVETPPQDWSGLLLARELGAGPALAGAGPLTFVGGVLVGRLAMDRLVDRLGGARVALLAGLLSITGMCGGLLAAAASGLAWPLLVGLLLAGVGASPVFPLMFTAADAIARRTGRPVGSGGSLVSAASRLGFLSAPLIVGAVAEGRGLLVALAITPIGAVLMTLTLPRLVRD